LIRFISKRACGIVPSGRLVGIDHRTLSDVRAEVTYVELAKRLKKHGLKQTEASITNKLKRGTFTATFFLG
jgi:hypothetical protein